MFAREVLDHMRERLSDYQELYGDLYNLEATPAESTTYRLAKHDTAKYGTPYFSNYINSDMEPSDVRSMCCRLRLDLRELRKKSGGYFGSGESTGSVGVVTINLPRIAYLSETPEEFYTRLNKIMDIAARSLKTKRTVITRLMDAGLYPYTQHYLGPFENHFSTIGLIGMNEVGLNAKWLRKDLTHKETQLFAQDVLNHMRERLSDYQEMYGDLYNLEATPAESTTYRLAKHDVKHYPGIITAAKSENETPYYTNSSHLPVGYTQDIFEALAIQDDLQTLYTSGTVFHAFLGERLPDWQSAAALVRKLAENFKLPTNTMSPTYSLCQEHGYIAGEHTTCPTCGKACEVWSRITGYYRPVQNWNDGKVQEYAHRKEYEVENSVLEGRRLCDRESTEVTNETAAPAPAAEDGLFLFTTTTCPNCKIAKNELEKAGLPYTVMDVSEHMDLVNQYSITQAPTLIVRQEGEAVKLVGASAIKKFSVDNKQ